MGAFKSSIKLIAEFIVVLGAVACILVWLKIEPKDLKVLALGNWMWLAAGVVLFAIGIGSSIHSWYLSAIRIGRLQRENTEAQQKLERERKRSHPLIERAGTLRSLAGQADWWNNKLEEIWHLWDADRTANEPLIYPLSTSIIPDVIKEWRHKELWNFRSWYRSHIGTVLSVDPGFHSKVVDDGFPRDGEKYLDVRRKIKDHAGLLRERADQLIRADAAGEEL